MGMTKTLLGLGILCGVLRGQAQAPIPDAATLMKDVEAHQARMDDIRENYTYHEITQTDEIDKSGKVKSTASEEHELFFVNGHRIRRLVKKNGAALSAGDQKNEAERVRKLVEKQVKAPRGNGGRGRDGNATFSMRQMLEVMRISNPRRVKLNGRDAIAYDFTGDRKAKAGTMGQNAARKMSGTVWFDEADRQVARVEARFDDNFRIGGGLLVNVQKGTAIQLDQAHVGQGLWMPAGAEVHVAARAFLVDSVRQNLHV